MKLQKGLSGRIAQRNQKAMVRGDEQILIGRAGNGGEEEAGGAGSFSLSFLFFEKMT